MVGGAETQLVRLVGELKSRQWDIRVISFTSGARMEAALANLGIDVIVIEASGPFQQYKRCRALIREIKASQPEALVTFMLQANVLGRLAGRLTRTPVVSSIRNSRFGGSSRLGQLIGDLLERSTARLATSIVVNSEYAARELEQRRVTAGATVHIIPNGVLKPEGKQRVQGGLTPTAFKWLAVGSLTPQKNYVGLAEGFQQVVSEYPTARLFIAGEGSQRSELEEAVKRLGLADNISLLGERHDIPDLLASADAFILASSWEGMPNVVMEAMSHAVPTVATPVGGVPELIAHGDTGWIAGGTGAADLAQAMLQVMNLPHELREAVAAKGKEVVLARFGTDRMVNSWAQVIKSAALKSKSDR